MTGMPKDPTNIYENYKERKQDFAIIVKYVGEDRANQGFFGSGRKFLDDPYYTDIAQSRRTLLHKSLMEYLKRNLLTPQSLELYFQQDVVYTVTQSDVQLLSNNFRLFDMDRIKAYQNLAESDGKIDNLIFDFISQKDFYLHPLSDQTIHGCAFILGIYSYRGNDNRPFYTHYGNLADKYVTYKKRKGDSEKKLSFKECTGTEKEKRITRFLLQKSYSGMPELSMRQKTALQNAIIMGLPYSKNIGYHKPQSISQKDISQGGIERGNGFVTTVRIRQSPLLKMLYMGKFGGFIPTHCTKEEIKKYIKESEKDIYQVEDNAKPFEIVVIDGARGLCGWEYAEDNDTGRFCSECGETITRGKDGAGDKATICGKEECKKARANKYTQRHRVNKRIGDNKGRVRQSRKL